MGGEERATRAGMRIDDEQLAAQELGAMLLAAGDQGWELLGLSTRWLMAGLVGLALLVRTDTATLVWVLGAVTNSVFSKVLKKTLNQTRPDGSALGDPGMPSSHAMSLFFLGTYVSLAIQEYGLASFSAGWPLDPLETQVAIACYAILASLWRVKAGFHTLPQIAVGAAVGTFDAFVWYHYCAGDLAARANEAFGGGAVPLEVRGLLCLGGALAVGLVERKAVKYFKYLEGVRRGDIPGPRAGPGLRITFPKEE